MLLIRSFVKHVGKLSRLAQLLISFTTCVAKVPEIFVIYKEVTVNGWILSQILTSVKILDMPLKDSA